MKRFLLSLLSLVALQAKSQVPDTTGFSTIKKHIGNHTIIGLGETGHGFESMNKDKAAFAGFLCQEMNFQSILFESPFVESVVAYLEKSSPDVRMKNFLYAFWNTSSVKEALNPFITGEQLTNQPRVLGFDVQEDCRFQKLSQYLRNKKIISLHQDQLQTCDSILEGYIGKKPVHQQAMNEAIYRKLSAQYKTIISELENKTLDPMEKKLLLRCLENRQWLCKYLTLSGTKEKMYYRDSLMAANIAWLSKEIYPGEKMIVWAADLHVAKGKRNRPARWMGEWLSELYFYPDQYFAVSFRKGEGEQAFTFESTTFRYSEKSVSKFDMTICLPELLKIKPEEWITPCD